MFFVLVEISNYRQLQRLRPSDASGTRGQLEHFCQNRGGRLIREQNGFFLFGFHPLRERVLDQVADFAVLTGEALHKRGDSLFGFNVLLDDADGDEDSLFHRLKSVVFTVPRGNRVWTTETGRAALGGLLPLSDDAPLFEILGPPAPSGRSPLPIETLVEMTGWVAALKVPLGRQLDDGRNRPGKILRLKGDHLEEKYFVLRTVLHQIYGAHEDFPVLFPLEESRDVLSQLLARVDQRLVAAHPAPDPAWTSLLLSRGGGEYPGDAGTEDVAGALAHYFRVVIRHWTEQQLPPVCVFLFPTGYHSEAQAVLEGILAPLVAHEGLRLLLLEHPSGVSFMGSRPSLSWSFPPLTLDRLVKERDARGWQERFPSLTREALAACGGRGMAWAHHLWALQDGVRTPPQADPTWGLLTSLESTFHKIYFVLCSSRGLLDEEGLIAFFEEWGEDAAVVRDKIGVLRSMGFLPGLWKPLRSDFRAGLGELLGDEARALADALARFLLAQWRRDHSMSEVLFRMLVDTGRPSTEVLGYYLTNKVNQGRGDFLALLRPWLWETAGAESDPFRLASAAAKLRFALNLPDTAWKITTLDRFKRSFTPRTESHPHGEWLLQCGRFQLRFGDWSEGFSLLKRALLMAQETQDATLEVRAEVEIGLALLRKNRLEEGREYFEIASRLAERAGSYLAALTASLDAVALFLLGKLSAAQKALVRGQRACEQGGLRKRRAFLHLVGARIAFDQGCYDTASVELDAALSLASRYHLGGAGAVLSAWRARCDVYAGLGGREALERLEPSAERAFFLAEAQAFDKDYALAAQTLDDGFPLVAPTRPFGSGEQVGWETGFAGLEDLLLSRAGDTGVLRHQMEAFRAYLSGMTGDAERAAREFQGVLSRKFLLDIDPASAQLFYWYYLVLPPSAQEAQRLTLLGRSLKDMQTRSSRIENPVERQDFLAKPYWNAQFAREARRVKLL